MMWPMREFDWSYALGMQVGSVTGILAVALVVCGVVLVLLIRSVVRDRRHG